MKKLTLSFFAILSIVRCFAQQPSQILPLSTQLTISSAKTYNKSNEVLNVFLIVNTGNQSVGTGFLIRSGKVITCEHVVHGAQLNQLSLVSPNGSQYKLTNFISDTVRDLAILTLSKNLPGGFDLGDDNRTFIGKWLCW